MKSFESNKLANTNVKSSISAPPAKPGRFRFPFKQKPSSTNLVGGGSPPSIPVSPPTPGFFNLRKLGFKPQTPAMNAPRKSVSFSSGRSAGGGSPTKDINNMDWKRKISADHTDIAYREAVGRLRHILSPRPQSRNSVVESPIKEKDLLSPTSNKIPITPAPLYTPEKKDGRFSSGLRSMFSKNEIINQQNVLNNQPVLPVYPAYRPSMSFATSPIIDPNQLGREDDLFGYIEKQGEYIAQLEKETKYSRDELSVMLDKVKDVIAENEALYEKQKRDLLSNMIQHLNEKTDGYLGDSSGAACRTPTKKSNLGLGGSSTGVGGSNVILESRVAELEAQLSQAKRSMRLAQEEILEMRRGKLMGTASGTGQTEGDGGNVAVLSNNLYSNCDLHRTEIDTLCREKDDLLDTLHKLKQMVNELRDRESDAAKKVKNSLDIVEQMQMEKAQSDMDTRRLKEELDRYQKRIREMIQDHSRRLHEEKMQVEQKYRQELDQLNNEMNIELDSLTKARLDLERQKRLEMDLRRELQQRSTNLEDLRQEMHIKIGHLQTELTNSLAQKSTTEQELINSRLNGEKAERDFKQDAARLQAEINGLRKRLEQSDLENVKGQELIVRLNETVTQLQRENAMARIKLEGHISTNPELRDADVVTIIQNMEDKHGQDMTELEQLIHAQNNLLDQLRGECKVLTEKLEETSRQYKKERAILENDRDKHAQVSKISQEKCVDLEQRVQFYSSSHDQMTNRLQKLEEDDKTRSARIFQLLTKQSGLLRENQTLQGEISLMKSKMGDQFSSHGNRSVM